MGICGSQQLEENPSSFIGKTELFKPELGYGGYGIAYKTVNDTCIKVSNEKEKSRKSFENEVRISKMLGPNKGIIVIKSTGVKELPFKEEEDLFSEQ